MKEPVFQPGGLMRLILVVAAFSASFALVYAIA